MVNALTSLQLLWKIKPGPLLASPCSIAEEPHPRGPPATAPATELPCAPPRGSKSDADAGAQPRPSEPDFSGECLDTYKHTLSV